MTQPGVRSLNLSVSVAVGLFEAVVNNIWVDTPRLLSVGSFI